MWSDNRSLSASVDRIPLGDKNMMATMNKKMVPLLYSPKDVCYNRILTVRKIEERLYEHYSQATARK